MLHPRSAAKSGRARSVRAVMQSRNRRARQLAALALVALGVVLVLLPGPATAASTFLAVADTYSDAGSPTTNFGASTTARADASPVRIVFVRFNVTGIGGPSTAQLRFFTQNASSFGFQVYSVSNTWAEGTLNANNDPSPGTLLGSTGAVAANTWTKVSLSVPGDGEISFAITTADNTALKISTRESGQAAQLLVPGPGNPSPFLITRDGSTSTYNATSQTTSTAYSGTLKYVVETAMNELNGFSAGGTINFAAGTFDLGTDRFEPVEISNITFAGAGMDMTYLNNTNSTAADTEPFDFKGAYFVTIRDMTICAGGPARTTSDAIDFDKGNDSLVENVKITCSRGRGIVFDGKDAGWNSLNNVVRNCVIQNVPSDGIELLASSNNRIEGCVVTNTGGHGIQAVKSSATGAQPNKKSNDNVITGNTVDQAGQDGINIGSSDRNVITGNTITNSSNVTSGRDGIRVASFDSVACEDNRVGGNTATDNQTPKTQKYGLHIQSALCNRTVVEPNSFAGNLTGEIRDIGTGTQYAQDGQAPSTPTGLAAPVVSSSSVQLTWNASNDNVGVTGYLIYRGTDAGGPFSQIAQVGGATLTHTDGTVSPNTSYWYTVAARDAVGNVSSQSAPPLPVTTPPAPPDAERPVGPASLTADAVAYNRVDLAWPAATDNIGVTGYTVYRGVVSLATVSGVTLAYQDTSVAPGTAYTYTVEARDAAGNVTLPPLPSASATTPAAPSSLSFIPVADAYVDASLPANNFGASTQIRLDGSPVLTSYLRFDVQGIVGTVTSAKVRIWANSASSVGYSIRGVADTTWLESTINASIAPPVGAVVGSSGAFAAGAYIEVDVTSLITGNGLVSLAATTASGTAISLASRESANDPTLVITLG